MRKAVVVRDNDGLSECGLPGSYRSDKAHERIGFREVSIVDLLSKDELYARPKNKPADEAEHLKHSAGLGKRVNSFVPVHQIVRDQTDQRKADEEKRIEYGHVWHPLYTIIELFVKFFNCSFELIVFPRLPKLIHIKINFDLRLDPRLRD